MRSIYLHSFLLIPLVVSDLCPRQSAKCKKEQRAITPKIGKAELQFFCTALLLNKRDTYIYIQSFLFIPLVVSKLCPGQDVYGRTYGWKDRQTYIRTDKAATIYAVPQG